MSGRNSATTGRAHTSDAHTERPRLGVSSRPLGEPVHHDGGHRFLTDRLAPYVEWVVLHPEDETGPDAPRETPHPRRGESGAAAPRRVRGAESGTDHTDRLAAVADAHRADPDTLDGCVLKDEPSGCGLFALPVSAEGDRGDGEGRGTCVERLLGLDPELPVEEEARLSDAGVRDRFVERIFAHARLRELLGGHWRPRDLVAFHSRHKLQLMAHRPDSYRALGRVVANAGRESREAIGSDYRAGFHAALALRATPGRHVNALHHAFGMVSALLDGTRRHEVLASIASYRSGEVPITVPAALIRDHCVAEGVTWAAEQTYLAPFPAELGSRDSPGRP
ncbi:YbgA family protein [Halostreptopolyspora alba]|uniref:DUF1722 domain-containing protein n=1 Tax=Halostreptopolyspora alba TaxID=2487137 RepID=A0A3N0ED61_9ACTN|nr:DUF1722 domain-containing protein [Nocardiopsaceae bacterium YIM 96095]